MRKMCKITAVIIATLILGEPTAAQGLMAASVQTSAQSSRNSEARVTLQMTNVTVESALKAIASQAGLHLLYNRDALPPRLISVNIANVAPRDAVRYVLRGTSLTAEITQSGQLAISAKTETNIQGVIAGKVTDSKSGKGVSGANISINAGGRGVVSDEDGSYRLAGVSAGTYVVSVRLVGYAKQGRSVTVGEGATVTVDFKLEPSANVLEQVIVTGTVVATELKAVPSAITVITAKQIEERGITRIDQLFRGDIPGLFALNQGTNTPLDQVIMFSRGATAISGFSAGANLGTNPIKTYVDGVEMADPQYLSQIDPRSIERIEILTGPQASTIYGANAINGVMQIFTKRGTGSRPQVTLGITSGFVQNNFSSNLTPQHFLEGSISGTESRMGYNAGGSWDYIGPWSPAKQTQRLGLNGAVKMDWTKLSADVSARRGWTRNNQRGSTEQTLTELRAEGVFSPGSSVLTPQISSLVGQTMGLTLRFNPRSWWSHEAVVGSDVSTSEVYKTNPWYQSSFSGADTILSINLSTMARMSQRYNTTVQLPVATFSSMNLTFGADHWRTTGESQQLGTTALTGTFSNASNIIIRNKPAKNSGVFVQGQLSFFESLFFTYGLRSDWNPNYGDKARVLPGRYGLSYSREFGLVSAKLRGSYGRSIRPPGEGFASAKPLPATGTFNTNLIAQYGNYDFQLSSPNLGPEHQQGGEGGLELYLGSRTSLVVTRYNQTVANLIDQVSRVDSVRSITNTPTSNLCSSSFRDPEGYCYRYQFRYLNVGNIRNQGWELQSSLNLGPFTTRGTYSWVKSRIIGVTPKYKALLSDSRYQLGLPANNVPEHTWALSVGYAHANSSASLFVNGTGPLYSSAFLADALSLATTADNRFLNNRVRMTLVNYRALLPSYNTVDLTMNHRFSSRADAIAQVNNLGNAYNNDLSSWYPTIGRQSKLGLRIRY